MTFKKIPPFEIRMQVLGAIDFAEGESIQEKIRNVSEKTFVNKLNGDEYKFTSRTISTWLYRYKSKGVTTLDGKTRADKKRYRKIYLSELAEAIHEVLPSIRKNKTGKLLKSVIYSLLLEKNFFTRSQLAPTTFYRMIRENDLLKSENAKKLRLSFAMQFANELWQADTMYGPSIKVNGNWKKTFLIAFIDDASRVITHGEFFFADNTENMIDAFKTALFKRGKPERLYFDNGSNYKSKEIFQACVRLNIYLSHAPIRDGSAKGKVERFFRTFRDGFLTKNFDFKSLDELNRKTTEWIESHYNSKPHNELQMKPIDRFNIDYKKIRFLADDQYSQEIFFIEQDRKVSKTNVFSINNQKYECPVDLRGKTIQVRFDRNQRNRFIVYFGDKRMGEALPLNTHANAHILRKNLKTKKQGDHS